MGYYKYVKKDTAIIEDLRNGVGVYYTSIETSKDGYFDIYLAATVENPQNNQDRDYYIAKYSTLYNMTEWYRHSR